MKKFELLLLSKGVFQKYEIPNQPGEPEPAPVLAPTPPPKKLTGRELFEMLSAYVGQSQPSPRSVPPPQLWRKPPLPKRLPAHPVRFRPSTSPDHYWRSEPVADVSPELAQRRPSFATQYLFCRRDSDLVVGMVRRIPPERWPTHCWGPVRTAWFSAGGIATIRHHSLETAKNFLERQFTRTVTERSFTE